MPQNLLDREMEKTRAINSNTHTLAVAQEEEEEATGKEGRKDGVKQATAAVYIKELRQGFENRNRVSRLGERCIRIFR